jgi:protein-S-isoprenylcysteine O-methyltransferase Ste14
MKSFWLGVRSLLWAIALPGVVAGYVPWRFFGLSDVHISLGDPLQLLGIVCIALGVALLAVCIWEFAHSGRGTLSPVEPPKELVVRGLYRYVRNPMYLSVTAIILGGAMLARSTDLLIYWAIWFVVVNLFVIGYEEPFLRRRFGESYERYKRDVGRWIPRLRTRERAASTPHR